jgi:hypothetical protein
MTDKEAKDASKEIALKKYPPRKSLKLQRCSGKKEKRRLQKRRQGQMFA